ncbi:MAG: ATP-binding protein, partial [Myxococcota bacterium]
VFLSAKQADPTRRGRIGRGLKELLAAMDSADVETVGKTIRFTETGRSTEPNTRHCGTRLVLRRRLNKREQASAARWLRLCIPPRESSLVVNGVRVERPVLVLTLPSCELETVVVSEGVERAVTRATEVSVFRTRRGEKPHIFELGIPIDKWNVPWHVDVHQRVPLSEGRDSVSDRAKLALKATLLDAMIHRYLDKADLRETWVQEVIGRWPVRSALLDTYASKLFPRGAVLGGTSRANDRAKQLGAHVVDSSIISHAGYLALGRVLESADDYVRRRSAEFEGEAVEPDETHLRFAEAVRWLARRVAGRVVRVRFFARDPNDAGLLEDANTDVVAKIISFNVRGPIRFDDVLDPYTLGIVLHEIAHLETPEHDLRFIDRLQWLGGQTAKVLSEGGPELGAALRAGDPDRIGKHH